MHRLIVDRLRGLAIFELIATGLIEQFRPELIEKSSKHWTKGVEAVAIQERAFEGVGLQMRLKPIRQVWKAWDGVIMTDGTACGFPDVLLRV